MEGNNLREIGRAYRTAAALGRIDRDRVEEHRRTLAALTRERAALQARVKELNAPQRKAQDARPAVERAVAARTNLVASIDAPPDLNPHPTGHRPDAHPQLHATPAQL